jgi:hypothetical protein
MGKVFKSAKKIVKKAAPVIGMVAANVIAPGSGFALAAGAGIGGLAGGYGVKNSLMMAGGAYGLSSLGVLGAQAAGPMGSGTIFGPQGIFGKGLQMGTMRGQFGIGNLIRNLGTKLSPKNFLSGFGKKGTSNIVEQLAGDRFSGQGLGVNEVMNKVAMEQPGRGGFGGIWDLAKKYPGAALGLGTAALSYLGSKTQKPQDVVGQATKQFGEYQSPVDIKYGTKFSGFPGRKVKGLFYNPTTFQYQDQPYVATAARGGIMSMQDFPRRQGQIDGPGTGTSDDVPAMLSDGEFVMTAKAVRGMGNGSRREGAKRMYNLMNQFERRAVA